MRELEVSAIIYPIPQTDRSLHGLAIDTTSRGFAMTHKLSWIAAIFATLALLLVTGCQQNQNSPAGAESEPVETSSKTVPPRERTIVLGDIDADELAKRSSGLSLSQITWQITWGSTESRLEGSS